MHKEDTIVARATPAGRGGIAVIRISGPAVRNIARAVTGRLPAPRYALLTEFADDGGEPIDTGLALFFPGPASFTGEDVLELHTHGGPLVCRLLIDRILGLGARLAEAGEFSRRAFLNDKIDLSQAEAIADLIDSNSRAAARAARRSMTGEFSALVLALNDAVTQLRAHVEAALDFPDEDIDFLDASDLRERLRAVGGEFERLDQVIRQGRLLRDGIHLVLAGRPNAGKSSLLNMLAGHDAAIVTEEPGTTRDLVQVTVEFDGLPVHIVDTAGLRAAAGQIESEGIRRARAQLESADHALVIVDAAALQDDIDELVAELPAGVPRTIVRNKIDLTGEPPGEVTDGAAEVVNISALTGSGVDSLRRHIEQRVGYDGGEGTMTARQRHLDSLRKAKAHFVAAQQQLVEQHAGELMAEELLQVQNALAEITGEFTSDDLLGEIFANFCIGK